MRLVILIFLIIYAHESVGQTCSSLSTPIDGALDVPVDSPIRWRTVPNIIGYVVSLGTTPGGGEIINRRSSGQNNFYLPEVGLPADTQIYVTIGYFKEGQDFTTCDVETFRTVKVTQPPPCTNLETPMNNSSNIAADTELQWNYAPTATGYFLSIGTSVGGNDVLDNFDVKNTLSYEAPDGLPADTEVFVQITPYNEIGEAVSCPTESFITTSAVIDCGPYFDFTSGTTITLGPEITIPDAIGLCAQQPVTTIVSEDVADGFRWYFLEPGGNENLISTEPYIELSKAGAYRYEAYNNISQSATIVECSQSKLFHVFDSDAAVIEFIEETRQTNGRDIKVNISGAGDYEFALGNREGPYQTSNTFSSVSHEFHEVFVRDKNGCGITISSIPRRLSKDDFPKFFTPNGDGVNDFWQFTKPLRANEIDITEIHIFNRFGHLLAIIEPERKGWNGVYQGTLLPESDYWYRAYSANGEEIRGHFALKR